jgi:hypothetical protein
VNAAPDRPERSELPASTIDLIRAHNQLDVELFEHVRASVSQTAGSG